MRKKSDYMETKWYVTKKAMEQWENQKGNLKNPLRQMTMKIQPFEIYGIS